jgi:hypothetical protein
MFIDLMITACIGCERRIKSCLETYCLDCEYTIHEVEEIAFDEGYLFGLTSRPLFQTLSAGTPGKVIVSTPYSTERRIYELLSPFMIQRQDLCIKDDVKRLHYVQAFLDGYTKGYEVVYRTYNQYRLVMKDFLVELGKRQAGLVLIAYILKRDKHKQCMVDFNLVPFIKKFIT